MNVCEPVLERAAAFDNYACPKGKGRERAQGYARTHRWFVKMDIRKYFDSIHQATLRELLGRKFKEPALLGVFDRILAGYHTAPGRGLPIGNLTSQHFANFYLSPLDRLLNKELRRAAYVRYMDDFVVWGQSGSGLRAGAGLFGGRIEAGIEGHHSHQPHGLWNGFSGLPAVPRPSAAGAAEQGAVHAQVPALRGGATVRPVERTEAAAADAGPAGVCPAGGQPSISPAYPATLWGGGQKARTA
jgi:Reverse transcriptase (RNA-dependent DNA polymerase)